MRLSGMKTFTASAAALAMCLSPTMAAAATTAPVQSVNPLVAVSAFGTQASAQAIGNPATASAAGAAVAVQADPSPNYGINWILLGLGALFFLGGIATLFADDDDEGRILPISPD